MRRILPGVVFLMTIWTAASSSGPVHDNFLLIANYVDEAVYQVDLYTGTVYVIQVDGVRMVDPHAVDYDPVEQRFYWSDESTKTIHSANLDGTDAVELVRGVHCYGLTVDHLGRSLLYTDYWGHRIKKVPLSGGPSTTIIQSSSDSELFDIKLDIQLGYIYWTDFHKDVIERADITGNDRQQVVSSGGDIAGLAISDKDLCWCDDDVKVECMERDGTNRRVIYTGECLRLDMSETHVYISDYSGPLKCNIAVVDLITLGVEYIDTLDSCTWGNTGIHLYASNGTVSKSTQSPSTITSEPGTSPEITSEPGTSPEITSTSETSTNAQQSTAVAATPTSSVDPCTKDRGGCGQYCSSSGPHVTCVCSNSFVLSLLDNKTCEDPCSEDNGGCSQVCSVENHEIVCSCDEGFVVDPVDSGKCREVDECAEVTCRNGGSCEDLVNRFFCRCTGDWRGIFCMQKLEFEPVVRQVQPTVGPVAGKTRITLDGEHLIPGVLVRLGPDHLCSFDSSTDNQAVVYTPPVDSSLAGSVLRISIEFPGFQQVETNFIFMYMKNPTLQSVTPLVSNAVGGTTLTVQGENLHVIKDPELIITMVHEFDLNSSPQQTIQQYTGNCDHADTNNFFCPTPHIDIPEAFEDWEATYVESSGAQSTTSPSSAKDPVHQQNDLTLVTADADQSLDFYIGFKLDGVDSYTNLSDTLDLFDNGKITFFTVQPQIMQMKFEVFVPYSGDKINIQGKDLTHGFQPSDYEVAIGAGWCAGVEVTDNEVICEPPDELPADYISQENRGVDGTDQKKRETTERTVLVHIGSILQMNAGALTYQIPQSSNKTAIIAGTVSCVAILALAVVIGAVVVRMKRRNGGEQAADSTEMRDEISHLGQSSPTGHSQQDIPGDAGSHGHHPPLQCPRPGYPAEGASNAESVFKLGRHLPRVPPIPPRAPDQQVPLEGYEDPIGRQQVPLEGYEVPIGRQQVPLEGYEVPIGRQQVPLEGYEVPIGRQQVPLEGYEVPIGRQQVPLEGYEVPIGRQQAPLEGYEVPIGRQQAPLKGYEVPIGRQQAPLEGYEVPIRR